MSSFSHESYLRKWAIKTNLSVISVDYTKTPEQQYPVQLEECYQAYKWILKNGKDHLNINLDKIILAGDSAGGNLALALVLRAIKEGVRLPDAMVLSYPSAYLHFSPSPSRIMSLMDPLLNFKLLEICGLEYYMNPNAIDVKNNALRNPFISPAIAPDELLKLFPRTMISIGALDPLFDDSIYLAKRMEQVKGCSHVKLSIYNSLGHGYLNLINFVPEANMANSHICDWINSIVNE